MRSPRKFCGTLLVAAWAAACSTASPDHPQGAANSGGTGATPAGGGAGVAASAGSAAGGAGASAGTGVAQAGGGATAGGSGGTSATEPGPSADALAALQAWLATPVPRTDLESEAFASVPLTASDAAQASSLLWADYAAEVAASRAGEMGASEGSEASLTLSGVTLRYYAAVRGDKPANGWNLFISMHGGGGTEPSVNDGQWENQIALVDGYAPENAIWVAPRAPTDEWNMWFREHMDPLFERLITNYIAIAEVDPNRVYLTGYSAGGDGAYQLGPRMADSWAGVGMSAGHPNDAAGKSLRNTAFALHVGALDTAYERNLVGQEWGLALDALAAADPGGYPHQWQIHDGLPHWMNLADAVSIPFLQGYTRDPTPSKVVWQQAATTRERLYWLKNTAPVAGSTLTASYANNTVELSDVADVSTLTIRLSDAMVDLDQPVTVLHDGGQRFAGVVSRTILTLERTLLERGDPALVFPAELVVELD